MPLTYSVAKGKQTAGIDGNMLVYLVGSRPVSIRTRKNEPSLMVLSACNNLENQLIFDIDEISPIKHADYYLNSSEEWGLLNTRDMAKQSSVGTDALFEKKASTVAFCYSEALKASVQKRAARQSIFWVAKNGIF